MKHLLNHLRVGWGHETWWRLAILVLPTNDTPALNQPGYSCQVRELTRAPSCLQTHSQVTRGSSSESSVNRLVSRLFSLLPAGTPILSSLALLTAPLLIPDSCSGEGPWVRVWCFLSIPFRFCIFGWKSPEGGPGSWLCVPSEAEDFVSSPSPSQHSSLRPPDSGGFCPASPL